MTVRSITSLGRSNCAATEPITWQVQGKTDGRIPTPILPFLVSAKLFIPPTYTKLKYVLFYFSH
jgi:hypothetical protein